MENTNQQTTHDKPHWLDGATERFSIEEIGNYSSDCEASSSDRESSSSDCEHSFNEWEEDDEYWAYQKRIELKLDNQGRVTNGEGLNLKPMDTRFRLQAGTGFNAPFIFDGRLFINRRGLDDHLIERELDSKALGVFGNCNSVSFVITEKSLYQVNRKGHNETTLIEEREDVEYFFEEFVSYVKGATLHVLGVIDQVVYKKEFVLPDNCKIKAIASSPEPRIFGPLADYIRKRMIYLSNDHLCILEEEGKTFRLTSYDQVPNNATCRSVKLA